jgi:hypothetical protein
MRVTRSLAPLQWVANEMGCDITVRSAAAAEKAQLLALDVTGNLKTFLN